MRRRASPSPVPPPTCYKGIVRFLTCAKVSQLIPGFWPRYFARGPHRSYFSRTKRPLFDRRESMALHFRGEHCLLGIKWDNVLEWRRLRFLQRIHQRECRNKVLIVNCSKEEETNWEEKQNGVKKQGKNQEKKTKKKKRRKWKRKEPWL